MCRARARLHTQIESIFICLFSFSFFLLADFPSIFYRRLELPELSLPFSIAISPFRPFIPNPFIWLVFAFFIPCQIPRNGETIDVWYAIRRFLQIQLGYTYSYIMPISFTYGIMIVLHSFNIMSTNSSINRARTIIANTHRGREKNQHRKSGKETNQNQNRLPTIRILICIYIYIWFH